MGDPAIPAKHDARPAEHHARPADTEGRDSTAPPAALPRRVTLLLVIGAGGAIGAAARYGTSLAIPVRSGAYPVATFLVNVVGAVILGAVAALPAGWLPAHELSKPAIGTGFCGGLTTFSTMSLEIYLRWAGHTALAVTYAAISLAAAPACAWAGFSLVRRLVIPHGRRSPPGPAKG